MGRNKSRSNAGSSPNLKPMEARLPMPNIYSLGWSCCTLRGGIVGIGCRNS